MNIQELMRFLNRDFQEEEVECKDETDVNAEVTRAQYSASVQSKLSRRTPRSFSMARNFNQIGYARGQSHKTRVCSHMVDEDPTGVFRTMTFDDNVYCCEYSPDGDLLCVATQDGLVRLFDEKLNEIKVVHNPDTRWAIVDVKYSPDKRFIAYSAWNPNAFLVNTYGHYELHNPIPIRQADEDGHGGWTCHFTLDFSPDSRYLASATKHNGDSATVIHDLEHKVNVVDAINVHRNDVNTVCFLDQNIVASGSDDACISIKDRRDNSDLVGGFVGHWQGITDISSRGDGTYFLSNSKDNRLKLWDLRKMNSVGEFREAQQNLNSRTSNFDYRRSSHQHCGKQLLTDNSVSTFQGHTVMRTLIRCGFSPMHTTGSRYVYSGGRSNLHVWDTLTGEIAYVLNSEDRMHLINRAVTWHPKKPIIAAGLWTTEGGRVDFHHLSNLGEDVQVERLRVRRHFENEREI